MAIRRIVLVFKTHFDIGFTKLSSEILDYYATDMLDSVAATCDATAELGPLRYVWTMPAWPLKEMRRRCTPARREKLDALVERGQVAWHALPFTSHYDFCGTEDALWGLGVARELSRLYGKPVSRAAKMTDVPGQGRFLPEMLASGGVEFLHLGCNTFAWPVEVPPIFWWEAPSGKRVLTMYNSGYGTSLLPPEDWPLDTWVAILNTQDNSGPQSAQIVLSYYDKLRRAFPGVEISCGSLDDAWNLLRQEDLSALPVVRQDLADTWIHGVASYPAESAQVRRDRRRLLRIGLQLAGERDDALRAQVAREMDTAYEHLMGYGEHTWGLDVKTWLGQIPDYDAFDAYRKGDRCRRMEASWQEQRDRATAASACCDRAEALLGLLPPPEPEHAQGTPRSGLCSLTSPRYRLDYNADTGEILRLYDNALNAPLLEGENGIFAYRYDRYSAAEMTEYLRAYAYRFSDWGIADNGRIEYPECAHVTRHPQFERCEASERQATFFYRAAEGERFGDAERVELTVTLPEDVEGPVHLTLRLLGKRATPYVESGALSFPVAGRAQALYINKAGQVLRPETDIASGANHAFYAVEDVAAIATAQSVVAVMPRDTPLVSIGENGVYGFRRMYEPHAPEIRCCLFNTMWGTNFPQWIEGDFTFTFDVLGLPAQDAARLYSEAETLLDAEAGIASPFVAEEPLRICGAQPCGAGTLLHVQNLSGEACRAALHAEGWTLLPSDLYGEPLPANGVHRANGVFAPFELRSYLAKREEN